MTTILEARGPLGTVEQTIRPDWPLVRAVQTMIAHGVDRLPVVDDRGRPLGVGEARAGMAWRPGR